MKDPASTITRRSVPEIRAGLEWLWKTGPIEQEFRCCYLCRGVMFSSTLVNQFVFVCYAGTTHSSVEGWHVSHGLDFDGNPDQITLGFGLRRGQSNGQVGAPQYFVQEDVLPGVCLIVTLFCDITGLGGGAPSTECRSSCQFDTWRLSELVELICRCRVHARRATETS